AYHAEQACLFAREIGLEDAPALASRAFLMLLAAATSSRDRADYHGSRALFQRAAAIGEASAVDPALLIEARGYAATSRLRLEGSPEALSQLELVLDDARRLGPSPVLANLLWWSAMYAMPVDAALARSRHLESINIARAVGDPATVAAALRQSAAPAAARGDLDEERSVLREVGRLDLSRAVLEDAFVVARGSAERITFAQLRIELARTLLALGDVQSARRCLEESEIPSTDVSTAAAAKATQAQIFAAERS